jgi:hypothetical protein
MLDFNVTLDAITPSFLYLAGWFALSGVVYVAFGFETKGRSFAEIGAALEAQQAARRARTTKALAG